MTLLRSLLFALFFCFAAVQPSYAQSDSDKAMATVQEIGQWAEAYYVVVDHLTPLFLNEHLDECLAAIQAEDETRLRKAAANYSAHRMDVLKSMKKGMNALPPPPDLGILGSRGTEISNALAFQKTQLPVIYSEAAQASGHLDTLLSRSGSNNPDGVFEIFRQQILASIRMLEAEIVQIDVALVAIPKDNPNRPFQTIVKAHNLITIEEMKMELKAIEAPIGLSERQSHIKIIKKQIGIAEKNIEICEANIAKTIKEFKSYQSITKIPEEKAFFGKIIKAISTFGPQMDVERQILAAANSSLTTYMTETMSDSYEEIIDANDNKIIELGEKRAEIMTERVSYLSK